MTGRIDYSPDYKSEKSKAHRLAVELDKKLRPSLYEGLQRQQAEQRIADERARLGRDVIEASKAWRRGILRADANLWTLESAFYAATDALLEFESSQEKKG